MTSHRSTAAAGVAIAAALRATAAAVAVAAGGATAAGAAAATIDALLSRAPALQALTRPGPGYLGTGAAVADLLSYSGIRYSVAYRSTCQTDTQHAILVL